MSVQILVGDAVKVLKSLPSESIQACITSPPYFQLRSYLPDGHTDKVSEIGLESTPAEFIATLVGVFEEVRRVLRPDGVCFVNLGDSYHNKRSGSGSMVGQSLHGGETRGKSFENARRQGLEGFKEKDLLLIPQRFAIAMQDAGWYVRSQIAWCKTSAMPESVKDRPTSAWEPIWMFTKQARYFWDQEAVRSDLKAPDAKVPSGFGGHKRNGGTTYSGNPYDASQLGGANLRNFWLLGPEPSREEHYAAFPSEIPRRCILAATSERGQCPACGAPWVRVTERTASTANRKHYAAATNGALLNNHRGTVERPGGYYPEAPSALGWQPSCSCQPADPVPQLVLDPFLGSGTTALVADQLGRNAIGCELSPTYAEMARRRIANDAPMFADVQVSA